MKTDLPDLNAIPKNRMTINRLFAYTRIPRIRPALTMALCAATLAGCAVGPDYVTPPIDVPATYKEDSLWKTAKPADEYPRGAWWSVFKDPELDRLMVLLNKQNLTHRARPKPSTARHRHCCVRRNPASSRACHLTHPERGDSSRTPAPRLPRKTPSSATCHGKWTSGVASAGTSRRAKPEHRPALPSSKPSDCRRRHRWRQPIFS